MTTSTPDAPSIETVATAPLVHGPYDTFGEVRRVHRGHFFDADTMRFFSSRIVDDYPRGGWFLRTTEQDSGGAWSGSRRCTLRLVTSWGDVEDVGEFGEFDTPGGASKVVDKFDAVTLSRVVDDIGRTWWHVHLIGAQTSAVMRAGSAFYDLPGALRLFDDLTGNRKRTAQHEAIAALSAARWELGRVSDAAAPIVRRQRDALENRRLALVARLAKAVAR